MLDQERGICGIFDGHLGDEAAAFCAERLHLHVTAGDKASLTKLLEIVMMLYAKSYPKVVKLEQRPPSHESWRTGTAPTTVPTP